MERKKFGRHAFGQDSRFGSPKRNILKMIRLFRGLGTGDPSSSSSNIEKEDPGQSVGYNPHAYAIIDNRLHEIEVQKAMARARTYYG